MADPFLGEVRPFIYPYGRLPDGWLLCDGSTYNVSDYQILYSIIHNTYGGDPGQTFCVPDLRGRIAVHGPTMIGNMGGEEAHQLLDAEVPPHSHIALGSTNLANTSNPSNATWAANLLKTYGPIDPQAVANLANTALSSEGGSQPHPNMQPYVVVAFAIAATTGTYPPRP